MNYYLENSVTEQLAHKNSVGEHDGLTTDRISDAAWFDTRTDAYDFAQNFGPDWQVRAA